MANKRFVIIILLSLLTLPSVFSLSGTVISNSRNEIDPWFQLNGANRYNNEIISGNWTFTGNTTFYCTVNVSDNDTYVPYTNANNNVNLGIYTLYANAVNATKGYFTELNVSNSSIWVGDVKISSNNEVLDISGNVTSNFFIGSGKYLTDINISTVNGTSFFNGNVSADNFIGYLDWKYILNSPQNDYYNKTEIDLMIANLNITGSPGNGTNIEVVNCDGTCTTVIDTEYY